MLRSVCFKNFVKFKEKQNLNFQGTGPFIFIGENGSGKSSVLEGIRRCLHPDLNTSFSSSPDNSEYSYFICNFETNSKEKEKAICGVVRLPGKNDGRYKFAFTLQQKEVKNFCADFLDSKTYEDQSPCQEISFDFCPYSRFIEAIFESDIESDKGIDVKIEKFLHHAFADSKPEAVNGETKCQTFLLTLSDKVVFTLPLRSIGPLQWSKSDRIKSSMKEKNYTEAEERCEVIRYFLESKDSFDKDAEKVLFEEVTDSDEYEFKLSKLGGDKQHLLLNGEKYALLKTPEGILEAKIFSILMSGKSFETVILEEPERGMHPQFIERMINIIKRKEKEKLVILTTHNPSLITPFTLTDCFVFRRVDDKTCKIYSVSSIAEKMKRKRGNFAVKELRLLTSDHLTDILFSRRVFFCEGPSDYLFLTELKRAILSRGMKKYKMLTPKEHRIVVENLRKITFLKMNGGGNVKLCYDFCSGLDITAQFLLDSDKKKVQNQADMEKNIFHWLEGDIEDMVIKMYSGKESLKKALQNQNVILTNKKGEKNNTKLFLDSNISVENVQESACLILENCESTDSVAKLMHFVCIAPVLPE